MTDHRFQANLNVGRNGVVANITHNGQRQDPTLFEFREDESDAANKKRVIEQTEEEIKAMEANIADFRLKRDQFLEDAVAFFRHEEEVEEETTNEE